MQTLPYKRGAKQGCPLSSYLFIIFLELMAIEMRQNILLKGVQPPVTDMTITSYSYLHQQPDNSDDRLSIFGDDSSTITTNPAQVQETREDIYTYKKASSSELYVRKTIIIKLGKSHTLPITQTTFNVNFTIMKDTDNETYLGDTIGNCVSEVQMFDKPIHSIAKLGDKWLQ